MQQGARLKKNRAAAASCASATLSECETEFAPGSLFPLFNLR